MFVLKLCFVSLNEPIPIFRAVLLVSAQHFNQDPVVVMKSRAVPRDVCPPDNVNRRRDKEGPNSCLLFHLYATHARLHVLWKSLPIATLSFKIPGAVVVVLPFPLSEAQVPPSVVFLGRKPTCFPCLDL